MNVKAAGAHFSVVIVNYNGGNLLRDCVRSLLGEGVPFAQIIVVDNGSADASLATLENAVSGTTIIRNPCNAGFARAVNQGIAVASGDFILLLNNDAQLQAGALSAFADAFDSIPRLAIAGGQLRYPDGRLQSAIAPLPTLTAELMPSIFLKWISPHRFDGRTNADIPIPVESVLGACVAVRRDVLPALGLLDEDFFFFFEETEWCRRAHNSGFQVYHLPAAQAVHLRGHTANRFRSGARLEYQRSKLTYYRKCRSSGVYLVLSAILVTRTFFNAAANTVLSAATLFIHKGMRVKMQVYWRLMAWHLLGRPSSWGLPGKCP